MQPISIVGPGATDLAGRSQTGSMGEWRSSTAVGGTENEAKPPVEPPSPR